MSIFHFNCFTQFNDLLFNIIFIHVPLPLQFLPSIKSYPLSWLFLTMYFVCFHYFNQFNEFTWLWLFFWRYITHFNYLTHFNQLAWVLCRFRICISHFNYAIQLNCFTSVLLLLKNIHFILQLLCPNWITPFNCYLLVCTSFISIGLPF
jgi:hypothetical protein